MGKIEGKLGRPAGGRPAGRLAEVSATDFCHSLANGHRGGTSRGDRVVAEGRGAFGKCVTTRSVGTRGARIAGGSLARGCCHPWILTPESW